MEKLTCREVALSILLAGAQKDHFVNDALSQGLAKHQLAEKDRALCTELVNGTLRWRKKLDWFISQFVDYPLPQLSVKLINILRLAFYQKLFLTKIPDHALVNEAVELAKKYEPAAAALVNAVLRKFLLQYKDVVLPTEADNPIEFMALKYSFPEWLIEYWYQHYSRGEIRSLCENINTPPPVTVRANQLLTTAEKLLEVLEQEGVKATPCQFAPWGLTVKATQALTELPSFKQGLFQVQSEASMLISPLLAPAPHSVVFDFCAGGGGKTSHLAALLGNTGKIVAFEINKAEARRLQKNLERLRVTNVETRIADLTVPERQWLKQADYILVDAPCSGLGTLRRYSDARWNKSAALIEEMAALQGKILEVAARYLKPKGRLVYAVCTETFEENELVVTQFMKKQPQFQLENCQPLVPASQSALVKEKIYFKTQSQRENLDGFFAVSLVKD